MEHNFEKIIGSPHQKMIDMLIDQGRAPSMIREELVRIGVDQYTLVEIEDYVRDYFATVYKRAASEHQQQVVELSSSLPVILLDGVKSVQTKVSYQALLELDVLRGEKLTQEVMASKLPLENKIRHLSTLARTKQGVVKTLVEFLEYKKAIEAAKQAQFQARTIDMNLFKNYINQLSDGDRSIALDTVAFIMEATQMSEAPIYSGKD